jgi:hypothetical protein
MLLDCLPEDRLPGTPSVRREDERPGMQMQQAGEPLLLSVVTGRHANLSGKD